jgi:hypothetical protein
VAEPDILALKRQLSTHLLAIPGVVGVGVGEHHVRVYLAKDDKSVRHAVESAVVEYSPGAPLAFEVSGAFEAQ